MMDDNPEPTAPTLEEIDLFSARLEETMKIANMADAIRNYSQNLISRLVAFDNRWTCYMSNKAIDFIEYLPVLCEAPPPSSTPIFDFAQTTETQNVLTTSTAALVDIASSWSGDSILLASQDATFYTTFSDFDNHEPPLTLPLPGETGYSHASAFHPSDRLVALSKGGTIFLHDLKFNQTISSIPAHASVITGLTFNSAGTILVSCSKDRRVVTQDMIKAKTVFDISMASPVNTLARMRDGSVVALGMENGYVQLFDSRTDQSGVQFEAHAGSVSSVVFNGTCDMLATVGTDRVLQVFDVRQTVKVLRSFKRHLEFPMATAFDGDGRVWSGTIWGEIQAWNINDGTSVLREPITKQPIYAMTYSEQRNSILYLTAPSTLFEKPIDKVEFGSSKSFVLKWATPDPPAGAPDVVP